MTSPQGSRWVAPPNWPQPSPGWSPPPGWQPDPSWGPAPQGWNFWQQDYSAQQRPPRNAFTTGAGASAGVIVGCLGVCLLILLFFVGCSVMAVSGSSSDSSAPAGVNHGD